jgi:hypothetical protein
VCVLSVQFTAAYLSSATMSDDLEIFKMIQWVFSVKQALTKER